MINSRYIQLCYSLAYGINDLRLKSGESGELGLGFIGPLAGRVRERVFGWLYSTVHLARICLAENASPESFHRENFRSVSRGALRGPRLAVFRPHPRVNPHGDGNAGSDFYFPLFILFIFSCTSFCSEWRVSSRAARSGDRESEKRGELRRRLGNIERWKFSPIRWANFNSHLSYKISSTARVKSHRLESFEQLLNGRSLRPEFR